MICERFGILLGAYRDGELDAVERSLVAEHLLACEACRGALGALEALEAAASGAELAPVAPVAHEEWARIRGGIRSGSRTVETRRLLASRHRRRIFAAATVAAAVLALVVSLPLVMRGELTMTEPPVAATLAEDVSLTEATEATEAAGAAEFVETVSAPRAAAPIPLADLRDGAPRIAVSAGLGYEAMTVCTGSGRGPLVVFIPARARREAP